MNAVNEHGETPLDMLYCLYQVGVEDGEDEDDLREHMELIEFLRSKGLEATSGFMIPQYIYIK